MSRGGVRRHRPPTWFNLWATGLLLASACKPSAPTGEEIRADAAETGAEGGSRAKDASVVGSDSGVSKDAGPEAVGVGLPCAVRALLETQCVSCHGVDPLPGALVSLVSRADLLKPSPLNPLVSLGQVSVDRMRSNTTPMPPGNLLPGPDIAPFVTWVAEGMPSSSCGDVPPPADDFTPLSREAALSKVKTFLTGLSPSPSEYATYASSENALPGLIDQWMATPEFAGRALDMFQLLFQQRSDGDEFGAYLRFGTNFLANRYEALSGIPFKRFIRESFARTAWEIVARDRPFTEVLTTRTFMLNVPLMMLLAYRDGARPQDDLRVAEASPLGQKYPDLTVRYTQTENIPFAQSVDPSSPRFGTFTLAAAPNGNAAACGTALEPTRIYRGEEALIQIFARIMRSPGRPQCWGAPSPLTDLFTTQDRELRPVTLERASTDHPIPAFWDLTALRATQTLHLDTEYVGFMGSIGFLSYWVTNDGNEYRGTANQALIVALGTTVSSNDGNIPQDDAAIDEAHATPGSICYGCHKTLDPLRDFFRQSYTYAGSKRRPQNTQNEVVPPVAVLDIPGAPPVQGRGVVALARGFAAHPGFARGWTRKLCGLINAGRCSAADPELIRVSDAFVASNYNFKVLIRELLSSPIVTHRMRTRSASDLGIEAGNALRDDFCRRLGARLGIHDVCNLAGELSAPATVRRELVGYARSIPEASYPRGAVDPDMVTTPSAFTSAAYLRLCEGIAGAILSRATIGGETRLLSATDKGTALDVLVERVMGVSTDDPRLTALRATLDAHWTEVQAQGSSAEVAFESTFTLACISPLASGTGL